MTVGRYSSTMKEFFCKRINIKDIDSCWVWTGIKNQKGYGRIRRNKIWYSSHRVSWELYFGEIPDDMLVLHKCDNPSCVNPDHLFLGTNQDNMDDKVSKGRQSRLYFERNPASRLSYKDVLEIRRLYGLGVSQTTLSRMFLSTQANVSSIILCKNWKDGSEPQLNTYRRRI
jgi:hypothetical protein